PSGASRERAVTALTPTDSCWRGTRFDGARPTPASRRRSPPEPPRTSGRPARDASHKNLADQAGRITLQLAALRLVRLDHLEKLLRLIRVAQPEDQAERQPVVGGLEQIRVDLVRRLCQDLAHRVDQRPTVLGPSRVGGSFHGNRVNWLPPPRGGGRVVECERLLSA